MKPFEVKAKAKELGIETDGMSIQQLKEAIEKADRKGGKDKGSSKKEDKSSKKSSKSKDEDEDEEEDEDDDEDKAPKKSKTSKSKGSKSKGKESSLEERVEALEKTIDELTEQLEEFSTAAATKPSKKSKSKDDDEEEDEDDEEEDDDKKSKTSKSKKAKKLPKLLEEYADKDGDLNISPDDVEKMRTKKLVACAEYLGLEASEDTAVPKLKKMILNELSKLEGVDDEDEDEDEDSDDEDEDSDDDEEYEPFKDNKSPLTEDFWDKKTKKRKLALFHEDEILTVSFSAFKKDKKGVAYIEITDDDGSEGQIYSIGKKKGTSLLGFVKKD